MLADRRIFDYMERELLGAVMTHVQLHLSKEGAVLDKLPQEDLCAFRVTELSCQKSVGKITLYYLMHVQGIVCDSSLHVISEKTHFCLCNLL